MDISAITDNSFLQQLKKDLGTSLVYATLTGGAIYDLLKGRLVKDWDFLPSQGLTDKLNEIAVLTNTTSTATTYLHKGEIIQVLKKDKSCFPFTIEQATFRLSNNLLIIDEQSIKTKILIPSSDVYNTVDFRVIVNCLRRLKHWEKKGMRVTDLTYNSILSLIKPPKVEDTEDEYES